MHPVRSVGKINGGCNSLSPSPELLFSNEASIFGFNSYSTSRGKCDSFFIRWSASNTRTNVNVTVEELVLVVTRHGRFLVCSASIVIFGLLCKSKVSQKTSLHLPLLWHSSMENWVRNAKTQITLNSTTTPLLHQTTSSHKFHNISLLSSGGHLTEKYSCWIITYVLMFQWYQRCQ